MVFKYGLVIRMEIYASSKRGTMHTSNNQSCQDSYLISSDAQPIVLTIADGHGGALYCRSDVGSKIACEAAIEIIKRGDYSNLPTLIKQEYDIRVKEHYEQNPLNDNETKLLEEHSYKVAYGSTLLIAVIFEDDSIILQLGDGEIHAIDSHGHFLPTVSDDEDCIGSFTSSICYSEEKAVKHFRVLKYPEKPALLIMYSDGYRNKYSRPYEIAKSMIEGADISEVAQSGEHGDDQTIIVAIDKSLTENEAFKEGFDKTLDEYKSEIITLQKKIAKEKLEEKIKGIEDFLFLAESKINESKDSGDVERLSRLETLSEQKRKLLESYNNELLKLCD